jgi:hypothetical protein
VSNAATSGFKLGVKVARKEAKKRQEGGLPPMNDLHAELTTFKSKMVLALPKEEKLEGWELLKREQDYLGALRMMKGVLFKRDQPYRTRLALSGVFSTNSSGVLNVATSVASIAGSQEWTSIDALFDECFVHSITHQMFPFSNLGGGVGNSGVATVTGNVTSVPNTANVNCAIQTCSLFAGSSTYGSAATMAANSTLKFHKSGEPVKETWRNNVKFEPRGICGGTSQSAGWQGWIQISDVAALGGAIQFRTVNDAVWGTGSAIVNIGSYVNFYDVSFRSRS